MATTTQIDDVGQRMGREFCAHKVILFGSYASGEPSGDSDVDLLVIMPFEGRVVDQTVAIRMKTRPPFPIDLLVRTPETIQKRLAMGDDFIRKILEEGRVLYEADIYNLRVSKGDTHFMQPS